MNWEYADAYERRLAFVAGLRRVKWAYTVAGFLLILAPVVPGFVLGQFVLPFISEAGPSSTRQIAAAIGFGLPVVFGLVSSCCVMYANVRDPRRSYRMRVGACAVLAVPFWIAMTFIAFAMTALYAHGLGGALF